MPKNSAVPNWKVANKFLEALDPDAIEFTFQTFADDPETKRNLHPRLEHQSLKAALDWLDEANEEGAGAFVAVQAMDGMGRKAENVKRIRAVYADLDGGMPNKKWPLEPSIVIESSPGKYHVYWLIDDEDAEMTVDQFRGCMRRLVQDHGADKQCVDPTRVLRLPGSVNRKPEYGEGHLVRFVTPRKGEKCDVYTVRELLKAFPDPHQVSPPKKSNKSSSRGLSTAWLNTEVSDVAKALDFLGDKECGGRDAKSGAPLTYATDYDHWWKFGLALYRQFGDDAYEVWRDWSHKFGGSRYDEAECDAKWATFASAGDSGVTVGSIFHCAKQHGWERPAVWPANAAVDENEIKDNLSALEFGVQVHPDEWKKELPAMRARVNKEHAVVALGNSVRYLHRVPDAESKSVMRFRSYDDMRALYQAVIVSHGPGGRPITAFDEWSRWRGRKQYAGIGLFPGKMEVPRNYLNLWNGFAVKPAEGDWSRFKRHLWKAVCGRDKALFNWLMDWLAHTVQRPEEKPGSAIVLRSSAKGSGKSMLIEMMRRIYGPHAMGVSKSEHIVGRFNAHLQQVLILGVEEAFWAGSKAAEGVIKNLITEPYITIEQKGVDPYTMRNFTRLIFTSNEAWTVPVGVEERRFLVLNVENPHANKREYFDPIWQQMENRGVEAMLHELLQRDITSDLRQPPETAGLIEQRKHSFDGVQKWVRMVAHDGEIANKETGQPILLKEDDETEVPVAVARAAAAASCQGLEARAVDNKLGSLLKQAGVTKAKRGFSTQRRRVYVFPPLPEFRGAVKDILRINAI